MLTVNCLFVHCNKCFDRKKNPLKQWSTGRKRGKDRNKKNWISGEWKSILDEKISIFHSFWRAIIWWKNKNLMKIADTSFKDNLISANIYDLLCLQSIIFTFWLEKKYILCKLWLSDNIKWEKDMKIMKEGMVDEFTCSSLKDKLFHSFFHFSFYMKYPTICSY